MGEANVTVEIVACLLPGMSLERNSVNYQVKTFWCPPLKINPGSRSGSTDTLKLPGLTKEVYMQKEREEEKVVICIQVSSAPPAGLSQMCGFEIETDYHIGVVICDIKDLLRKPYLNPSWEFLPILNLFKGTSEGKMYVKVEARFVDSPVSEHSTQTSFISNYNNNGYSNSALQCPPHLIDHVAGIISPRKEQVGSSESEVTRDEWEQFKKPAPVAVKSRPVGASSTESHPREGHPMVIHNMCTSPEFPFHIPEVEKAEKRFRFQQQVVQEEIPSDNNVSRFGSPPLFANTPRPNPNYIHYYSPQRPNHTSDKVTTRSGHSVRTDENVRKAREEGNCAAEREVRPKPKEHTKPSGNEANRVEKVKNSNVRIPLSPKSSYQVTDKPQPKIPVPGLTIKSYKPPIEHDIPKADDLQNQHKRRNAANIFNHDVRTDTRI